MNMNVNVKVNGDGQHHTTMTSSPQHPSERIWEVKRILFFRATHNLNNGSNGYTTNINVIFKTIPYTYACLTNIITKGNNEFTIY